MASPFTASSPRSSISDTAAWLSAAFVAAFFRSRSPAFDTDPTILKLPYLATLPKLANSMRGEPMARKRYRVAQWGTGHTGLRSLQTVLDHPQYDLVGLRVYSDAKIGRDAG